MSSDDFPRPPHRDGFADPGSDGARAPDCGRAQPPRGDRSDPGRSRASSGSRAASTIHVRSGSTGSGNRSAARGGASSSSRATAKGPGGTGAAAAWSRPPTSAVSRGPAPFVLLLHGYAVPQTTYDRWLAKQMRLRGAHTARLDLPVPPEADAPRTAERRRVLQPRSGAHSRRGPSIGRGRCGGDRLGTRRGQPAS